MERAGEWLRLGATVIEKNVFALPSRWRPDHPRYLMAVLSHDGLDRYAWRSYCARLKPVQQALVLPNPVLIDDIPAGRVWRDSHSGLVKLLRIGRPDPRKWTDFECRWSLELARRHPDRDFHLRLVGAPDAMSNTKLERQNLRVTREPYSEHPADVYAGSDVLVHHSRIGETFGNTLYEAVDAGLGIVCSMSPHWDCAPAEYLRNTHARLAAPEAHLADPRLPVRGLLTGERPIRPTAAEYIRAMTGDGSSLLRLPVPSPSAARASLLKCARELQVGVFAAHLALAREGTRSVRHRNHL
jgi:hypothetical protein